jgi:CDI immunity proteins
VNLNKSLEELENDFWAEPSLNSNLALKCHEFRKLPISKLSVEDLRFLIGQKIGLSFLVPLALELLELNPLVAGEMYKGDLLANVSAIPEDFWCKNPELNNRLVEIANEIGILSETLSNHLLPVLSRFEYK